MNPTYNPRIAWAQAGLYFVACFALSWATGVLPTLLSQPLATAAQMQSPAWLAFTALCFAVEYIAYVLIWPRGTLTHGRKLYWPAVLIFGLLWGVSEGQLFLVIWTVARRWLASPMWAALVAFVVISAFLGLWHALYWDIRVAPEHNLPEWNGRKVLFAHIPNLIVTLTHLHFYGNAGLFVLFQTFSLMASTYFMRFPPFWSSVRSA